MIRLIKGKGLVREVRIEAILGKYSDRLNEMKEGYEIADPDIETKLTSEELKQLYAKFPYLDPNRPLPPKPSTEPIAFREEVKEDVIVEEVSEIEELTNEEIVEWLIDNEIEFDKRKKNNTDYLIEKLTEND